MALKSSESSFSMKMIALMKATVLVSLFALIRTGAMATAVPLIVTVSTDKVSYAESDLMRVIVRIKNTSSAPIEIPVFDGLSSRRYITVNVSTTSGVPIFFISREFDAPTGNLPGFQTIPAGGEVSVEEDQNQSGFGFLGYQTAAGTTKLQHFSGAFKVTAAFTVTQATLPPNPGQNAFIGSVSSTDNGVQPLLANVILGDVNGDGVVDCADLNIIRAAFGKQCGQTGYDIRADVNQDCVVDVRDLVIVSQQVPKGTKCP
jgi:hypothetical protein